jgi:hypothetical protein
MTVRRETREESLRNYTNLDVYNVEKFTVLTLRTSCSAWGLPTPPKAPTAGLQCGLWRGQETSCHNLSCKSTFLRSSPLTAMA